MNGTSTARDPAVARGAWSPAARGLASAVIAFHLAAVILAPLAVEPTSALFSALRWGLSAYIDAAYLNHGYHFFAPEPGPSHLISYELELPQGEHQTGVFPDRRTHRPRLFYHRHFMLSEKLLPLTDDPKTNNAIVRSYAAHVLEANPDAVAVELTYREHLIVDPREFQAGKKTLDDRSLYRERKLGRFSREPGKTS